MQLAPLSEVTKHRIDTGDAYAIRQHEIEARDDQSTQDKDITEPSTSSWSSRVVRVKKTDFESPAPVDFKYLRRWF